MKNWRKRQVQIVEASQNRIVRKVSERMDEAMMKALNQIWATYEKTGHFFLPSFYDMQIVTNDFYHDVIIAAMHVTETAKRIQRPKEKIKKLAKGPMGLPFRLRKVDDVLKNKKYYQAIMKRSKKMNDKMRASYLKKIKDQYAKIQTLIESGEISPADAKKQMIEAYQASKPRVRTIFQTETTSYYAKVQVNFFRDDEDIIGFMFDSVRDSSRTSICKSRHGLIYRQDTAAQARLLDENTPACHYNCRSHLIPLAKTSENIKLLLDPKRDPMKITVVPLPIGWRRSA